MAIDAPQTVGGPSPTDFDIDPVQMQPATAALATANFWELGSKIRRASF